MAPSSSSSGKESMGEVFFYLSESSNKSPELLLAVPSHARSEHMSKLLSFKFLASGKYDDSVVRHYNSHNARSSGESIVWRHQCKRSIVKLIIWELSLLCFCPFSLRSPPPPYPPYHEHFWIGCFMSRDRAEYFIFIFWNGDEGWLIQIAITKLRVSLMFAWHNFGKSA